MKFLISSVLLVLCLLFSGFTLQAAPGERIKYIPVQDGGRIKPFDSFARETLELIYGRSSFKRTVSGQSSSREPAYIIVMSFLLSPESWVDVPVFEVKNFEVKKYLNLPQDQKYYTGNELFKGELFANLMQQLADKRETKEKLTPYYQAIQRLENQFFTFREITAGRYIKIIPPELSDEPRAEGDNSWVSVADLPEKYQGLFINLSQNLAKYLGEVVKSGERSESVLESAKKLDESVDQFINTVKTDAQAKSAVSYNQAKKVSAEIFYNEAHIFRWSYIFYLLGALTILVVWIRDLSRGMKLAWILTLIGFTLQTIGFLFRVYLAERPPVTNMYETVVWVSWGAVLFAMILEKIYRYKSILLSGLLVGVFSMVVADMAPAILDPSIQPLEAVLRSNYWLIIHVMTITISYAAFFLALALGDLGLIYYVINPKKYQEQIRNISTAIYRAMQIGVAFLAPGIILGGVWADYSWGRFWGWDPKETWALIVLLGYIIVLHARLVNWIQNFGMLVSGILTFNLVIMAWYGVNYVLGAGLHSYGFGAGGIEYVSVFTLAHVLFVIYAAVIKKTYVSASKDVK